MTSSPQKKRSLRKLKSLNIVHSKIPQFSLKLFPVYNSKIRNIDKKVPTKIELSFAMILKLAYPPTKGIGLL